MSNKELLITVLAKIPFPTKVENLTELENGIRFSWRGQWFWVHGDLNVEEVEALMLIGSNSAVLLEALLKSK
jgi:hypothetical protein